MIDAQEESSRYTAWRPPINDSLTVWIGVAAALSIGMLASLAEHGAFRGTRLAVVSLFEHLDQGSTIDEFLEWFPSVNREQVHEVLAFAKSSLEQPAAVA